MYLRERPHDVPEAAKMSWWAPVVVVHEDSLDLKNTNPAAWMKDRKELKIADMPGKDKFIVVNPEEIGKFVQEILDVTTVIKLKTNDKRLWIFWLPHFALCACMP